MYDPKAKENAKRELGTPLNAVWCGGAQEAMQGADAVVIATEWAEFASLNFEDMKRILKQPVFFDLRNIYPKTEVAAAGFEYHGTGV